MSQLLTISVDTISLLAAIDRLGDHQAEARVKAAAKVTADRIQTEARARVRRATGATATAITVQEAPGPLGGYRVFVGPTRDAHGFSRPDNLPLWLEFGTRYMGAQPFLFNSARLEEGPHLRRVAEALQDAIDDVGLGAAA